METKTSVIKELDTNQDTRRIEIGVQLCMAKNRNFDRNRVRGCNFGSEGGAVLDLRGCSSLPKEEERLREPMR